MVSNWEQNAFASHPLKASSELDLGDGERMSQVQTSVHVRIRESSEPFRVLLLDFIDGAVVREEISVRLVVGRKGCWVGLECLGR